MDKKKVLRLKEVEEKVGLKKSSIYHMVKKGFFPKPISLGPRAVGFIEREIDDWLSERISQRDNS